MKRIPLVLAFLSAFIAGKAQDNVYPAPDQQEPIALTGGTVHVGNGQVIENGTIIFSNGKITEVGTNLNTSGAKVIDCSGRHIYPGLISPVTDLGLNEIGAVRASRDVTELGENNASVRSIVAYAADSRVINTLRSNGILLANVVPRGGIISGSSSVVQLDAWNWEDAVYRMDGGIHFRMPSLAPQRRFGNFQSTLQPQVDPVRAAFERIDRVRSFFREAQAYFAEPKHAQTNLKFEAVKGLFNKTANFYIHCELVKEIMVAVEFAREFGFNTVLVGGSDSWRVSDYLKQNNISVILNESHSLPVTADDDVDQPYKTPFQLQQAGVLFCISDQDDNTRGRNLMFNAGTAAAYGLTREQALQAITLNAAKILGIDAKTGSLEKGKDANIVISEGDILDMKTSKVTAAFIQGRTIDLTDKHKQLYERYKHKYQLN
ncbi:MAG TPA: amidohydrolase family protein [Chitinophagaceae bacterium]